MENWFEGVKHPGKYKVAKSMSALLAIIGVTFACMYYYYCLHLGFTPNGEELLPLWYIHCLGGEKPIPNDFFGIAMQFAYQKFGISYTALRVSQTMIYGIIVMLSLILSLNIISRLRNWYILPTFVFLLGVLHIGESTNYGRLKGDYWGEYGFHQYPLDNHTLPTIFALGAMICFIQSCRAQKKGARYGWGGLAIASILGGIFKSDILFFVIFLVPVCLVLVKEFLREKKNATKYIACILTGIVSIVFLMKMVYFTTPYLNTLFHPANLSYGNWEGNFYGAPSYANIKEWGAHLLEYFSNLSGLFNMDISGKPMVSVYLIFYCIRLLLVLIIFWIIKIVLVRWYKERPSDVKDYVDIVLSLGVVLLSLAVVFTNYTSPRYTVAILPFGTILLCRNLDVILKKVNLNSDKMKLLLFLLFVMCCAVYAKAPGELKKNPDVYDDEYQEIIEIVQDNQLGAGVGSLWLAPVLSSASEGKINVATVKYKNEIGNIGFLGISFENTEYRYLIQGEGVMYQLMSDEQLENSFGKPAKIYLTEHFNIYTYDYDISTRFE